MRQQLAFPCQPAECLVDALALLARSWGCASVAAPSPSPSLSLSLCLSLLDSLLGSWRGPTQATNPSSSCLHLCKLCPKWHSPLPDELLTLIAPLTYYSLPYYSVRLPRLRQRCVWDYAKMQFAFARRLAWDSTVSCSSCSSSRSRSSLLLRTSCSDMRALILNWLWNHNERFVYPVASLLQSADFAVWINYVPIDLLSSNLNSFQIHIYDMIFYVGILK